MGRVRRVLGGLLLVASVAGCLADQGYDERGNGKIAATIEGAHAPGVESVNRRLGDDMDSASIDITMAPSATRDQMLHVLCDVVIPARDGGQPSDGLGINLWLRGDIVLSDLDESSCHYRASPSG